VGNEAGLRFRIWYEHYRKFEPAIHSLIEEGGMTYDFNSLLPTEKIVFVISACYHAKQKVLNPTIKNRFLYLENLCNFFSTYQVDSEVQMMGLYNSFDFEMITKHKLYECKKFFDVFSSLNANINIKK
jgi:hypothetical protein